MTAALPEAVKAAGTPVEVWHQDGQGPKAIDRVGQQGTLTNVWARLAQGSGRRSRVEWQGEGEKGSQPDALKNIHYEWAYLFGGSAPSVAWERAWFCRSPTAI